MEFIVDKDFVDYETAVSFMEQRVADIYSGEQQECVWFLQHPPLYTSGTSAKPQDLLNPFDFPVHQAGRGGQYTYHGPGQIVGYVMLDLRKRGQDVRKFIAGLEQWIIESLADMGVKGEIRDGRVGVWVQQPFGDNIIENKIAAIGIRLRRWISFHGISLNVCPDLHHFSGIIPCGIREHGVTSLHDLGKKISLDDTVSISQKNFDRVF